MGSKWLAVLLATFSAMQGVQGATPDFGPNVMVFDPSMKDAQKRMDDVFAKQEAAQFGNRRVAYLLMPGKYQLDVQVGFYMQVLGLGASPDDVEVTGAVRSKARWMRANNATCNFWRAAENLSVVPTQDKNVNIWAVSQGVDLRRIHVKGDMNLSDGGWSSGGFLADSKVDGVLNSGSQQQWLSRNDEFGKWNGANWNMVFVGVKGEPAGEWPAKPYTKIEKTPVEREKPYVCVDGNGNYFVAVPGMEAGTSGTTWSGAGDGGAKAIPMEDFYVAKEGKDTAASMNAALAAGKNLLITPGLYPLEDSLKVAKAGTIVLGIGFPTLTPTKGTPALEVADADGVKIGGLLLEAGQMASQTLMQVGSPVLGGKRARHASDPIFLWDIFARAGGAVVGKTACFVTIDANNVVGDNFWLWRADHGRGAGWQSNENLNGLVVNGEDVTFYGLFVEHSQGYQTLWNGERGRVYFYQSEMPYDPPNQQAWMHEGDGGALGKGPVRGFASYKVGEQVTTHEAWGLGVYAVFNSRNTVVAETAIETPVRDGVQMHHMLTMRLNGDNGSGIAHVINEIGDAAIRKMKAVVN